MLSLDNIQMPIKVENILSQYSEEYLYKMYCNDFPKNLCHSPFRKDKTPSFSFYRRSRWYWKDLATNEKGDVFQFIQKMENTADLHQTLKILSNRLSLTQEMGSFVKMNHSRSSSPTKKLLQFVTKHFDEYDMNAWGKWGIAIAYCRAFNTGPAHQVFLNKELIWRATKDNPIYFFHFIGSKNNKGYRPFEGDKKKKFIGVIDGKTDIFGLQEFRMVKRRHRVIVLTKAMKEVMFFKSFGITAIALCGEGYYFPKEIIEEIQASCDYLVSFYDNDRSGAKGAWQLRRDYGIPAVFIHPKFNIKNVTDMWEADYKMTYSVINALQGLEESKYIRVYDKTRSKTNIERRSVCNI
jgi:hypothetical protein